MPGSVCPFASLRGAAILRPLATVALAVALLPAARDAGAYATRHVVIVVIDGTRYSEGLGAPGFPWHPRQGLDLAPLGCQVETFLNLGVTNTNPGHSAILTGTWQPIANDGTEQPHAPTAFERYRAATGAPSSQTWWIGEKLKLAALAYSDAPGWGAAFGAATDIGLYGDEANMTAAIQHLRADHPAILVVTLGNVDWRGHQNDWPAYTRQLQIADSLVYSMWDAIQADSELANRTSMFVTNDHGRHDDAHGGFINHGCDCFGCRRIQLLALGPDFKTGHVSSTVYRQIDILPTVANLLGFPAAGAVGSVMVDLLVNPEVPTGVIGRGSSRLALSVPAPVPSTGSVRLALDAPPGARVEVDVIDSQGRRVAWLHRGPGGPATLVWNARSGDGRALPAGVYLVRARRGEAQVVRRVVLAR